MKIPLYYMIPIATKMILGICNSTYLTIYSATSVYNLR